MIYERTQRWWSPYFSKNDLEIYTNINIPSPIDERICDILTILLAKYVISRLVTLVLVTGKAVTQYGQLQRA